MINEINVNSLSEAIIQLENGSQYHNQLPFLITIKDVSKRDLDKKKYSFSNIIDDFFNDNKLDNRWNPCNDWYLSYSRRLLRKIKNKTMLDYAANILIEDKNTRRCVINTNIDQDMINGFCPALSLIQFKIVNNKLEMYAYWRSQEAIIAFPLNTLCMFSYQRKMLCKIKKKYKGVKLGKYTAFVNEMQYDDWDNYNTKEKEKKFKFYCSIIDYRGEVEYDKNYER